MERITTKHVRAASLLAALSLAACSGSGTNPVSTTQENLAANVLQLSVGTARIAEPPPSLDLEGLNVVVTYRQPHGALHPGDSAVATDTPKLITAAALPSTAGTPDANLSTVETGPAPVELGTHTITGTLQSSTTPTSFGLSGSASGLGIEPLNYGENGLPYVAPPVPYTEPLYDPLASSSSPDPNAFVPWGGPPAFPDQRSTRNAGQLGYEEGLDVFAGMAPVAGPYTLSVTIQPNTGTVTFTTNAGLKSTALLPTFVAPTTATMDGNGGVSVPVVVPSGVTETYVQFTDLGPANPTSSQTSCNGSTAGVPTYYTVLMRGSGTATLSDTLGPTGTPSICTAAQNTAASGGTATPGDTFTVQFIGFDYPWYEASYPQSNGNPAPTLAGGNGQSDITISTASAFTSTARIRGATLHALPRGTLRYRVLHR